MSKEAVREKFILPYGDHHNDGIVQVSFTLPVPDGPMGDEAARQVMRQMSLRDPRLWNPRRLATTILSSWDTVNYRVRWKPPAQSSAAALG